MGKLAVFRRRVWKRLFGRRLLGRHLRRYAASISGSLIHRSQAGEAPEVLSGRRQAFLSLAPFGPLKRRRARRRIRSEVRRRNSISTFFRRRQNSTYSGVEACARATSRAIFVQIPRDLASGCVGGSNAL